MEDRFNPFGLVILVAAIAAAFTPIQEALDEQGIALYLPSFGPHPDDGSDQYWAAVGDSSPSASSILPVPTPPNYPSGSALPPPPIAQGGPAVAAPPPGRPPAAAAAPPPAPAGEEAWQVDRAGLESLLRASGGMNDDGCLETPVIVEGMQGVSRVEASPTWQPGARLVFSVEPTQGAVQCIEFVFDKESPQW